MPNTVPAAAIGLPIDRETLEAYREWLDMEGRLCGVELYPELGTEAHRYVPKNTFADAFHFPEKKSWKDVPKPSTRAKRVLQTVGALPSSPPASAEEYAALDFEPLQHRENEYVPPSGEEWPQQSGAMLFTIRIARATLDKTKPEVMASLLEGLDDDALAQLKDNFIGAINFCEGALEVLRATEVGILCAGSTLDLMEGDDDGGDGGEDATSTGDDPTATPPTEDEGAFHHRNTRTHQGGIAPSPANGSSVATSSRPSRRQALRGGLAMLAISVASTIAGTRPVFARTDVPLELGFSPALAGRHPDAELLALGREYGAASSLYEAGKQDAYARFEEAVRANGGNIWDDGGARYDSLARQTGYDEVEALSEHIGQIEEAILLAPAKTMDGLAVKARVLLTIGRARRIPIEDLDWDERIAHDLAAQLLAIGVSG